MNRAYHIREVMWGVWEWLESKGYEVIYMALYGSDNYGLSTPASDMDFKAMVVPRLEDIVKGKQPISTQLEFDVCGEVGLVDVKDCRKLIECWHKQNITYIELLFTEHYLVTEKYRDEIETLRVAAEQIAHMDEKKVLSCIKGMAMEKKAALFKDYPSQKAQIDRHGYAGKQLHHIIRLADLAEQYTKGYKYTVCLTPDSELATILRNCKTYKTVYTPEEALSIAESCVADINELRETYESAPFNEAASELLDTIRYKIIYKALTYELGGGGND